MLFTRLNLYSSSPFAKPPTLKSMIPSLKFATLKVNPLSSFNHHNTTRLPHIPSSKHTINYLFHRASTSSSTICSKPLPGKRPLPTQLVASASSPPKIHKSNKKRNRSRKLFANARTTHTCPFFAYVTHPHRAISPKSHPIRPPVSRPPPQKQRKKTTISLVISPSSPLDVFKA